LPEAKVSPPQQSPVLPIPGAEATAHGNGASSHDGHVPAARSGEAGHALGITERLVVAPQAEANITQLTTIPSTPWT
jgi:hypothetical protein